MNAADRRREGLALGGLTVVLLVAWLGFLAHRSPDFAGSAAGGLLGVSGAVLMLVPLAYSAVKRIGPLKRRVTRIVPLKQMLTWHIYAGLLGPVLVLLHSGHKFNGPLATTLTAMTLVVAVSGYVGYCLMGRIGRELKDKRAMLADLERAQAQVLDQLKAAPEAIALIRPLARWRWLLWNPPLTGSAELGLRAVRLTEAIADTEYAIATHALAQRLFTRWLRLHIVLSAVLYVLLALHVTAAVYFGLRWFA